MDGFRFDLASVMCRDGKGQPLAAPPIVRAIAKDPVLSKVPLQRWCCSCAQRTAAACTCVLHLSRAGQGAELTCKAGVVVVRPNPGDEKTECHDLHGAGAPAGRAVGLRHVPGRHLPQLGHLGRVERQVPGRPAVRPSSAAQCPGTLRRVSTGVLCHALGDAAHAGCRKFIKGDAGMKRAVATRIAGSADLYQTNNRCQDNGPFLSFSHAARHFTLCT